MVDKQSSLIANLTSMTSSKAIIIVLKELIKMKIMMNIYEEAPNIPEYEIGIAIQFQVYLLERK